MSVVTKHTEEWWKDATVYQIYPRSFLDADGDGVGDIQGIRSKLDYLHHLGVDAIWLTPIYESPNADWGYDVSNYYDIDPTYGSLQEFDYLLEELHSRDMRLIMDLVVNHTSTEHPWFRSSLNDPHGPHRDYYIWKQGTAHAPPNNWDSFFGGSAWEYRSEREAYYLHLFAVGQADLNWENPEVREEVYRIIDWWFDRGIDGFRMDVINMISKDPRFPNDTRIVEPPATRGTPYFVNGPKLHTYLREMRQRAWARPGITVIGETPGAGMEDVAQMAALDRSELDMAIQMELMELDHGPGGKWDIVTWTPQQFSEMISRWQVGLAGRAWPANFHSNHDQPRALSRFGNDQEYRYESATMLAVLLLTRPGTPFVYYGEEIGMPNADYEELEHYLDIDSRSFYSLRTSEGHDAESVMKTIRYMSRDNARSPMQWTSGENVGFTKGTPWIRPARNGQDVSVESEEGRERSVLKAYRQLLRLRKREPALRRGSFTPIDLGDSRLFCYQLTLKEQTFLILLNLTQETVELPEKRMVGAWGDVAVYGNYEYSEAPRKMAPYEAVVNRPQGGREEAEDASKTL